MGPGEEPTGSLALSLVRPPTDLKGDEVGSWCGSATSDCKALTKVIRPKGKLPDEGSVSSGVYESTNFKCQVTQQKMKKKAVSQRNSCSSRLPPPSALISIFLSILSLLVPSGSSTCYKTQLCSVPEWPHLMPSYNNRSECLASCVGMNGEEWGDGWDLHGIGGGRWSQNSLFFSFVSFPKVFPSTQGSDDLISNFLRGY